MPTETQLAFGKIKISLVDPNFPDDKIIYFGMFQKLGLKDSEQLTVFYAPDDSSPTLRARFGALKLRGPGQISLSGILASTRPDSDYFCAGFDNLIKYAIERHIWEKIRLDLDFTFDDTADRSYILYDAAISSPNMQVQGNMMSGNVSLLYSRAEPD